MKRLILFVVLSSVMTFGQTINWNSLIGKHVVVLRGLNEPGTTKLISLNYMGKPATIIGVKLSGLSQAPDAFSHMTPKEAMNAATVSVRFEDGIEADTGPVFLSSLPFYFQSVGNETASPETETDAQAETTSEAKPKHWLEISATFKSLYNWVQMTVVFLALLIAGFVWRIYMQKLSRTAILARVLTLQIIIVGACVGLDSLLDSRYPIIFAIIATGLLTFYALLLHIIGLTPDAGLRDADIRNGNRLIDNGHVLHAGWIRSILG